MNKGPYEKLAIASNTTWINYTPQDVLQDVLEIAKHEGWDPAVRDLIPNFLALNEKIQSAHSRSGKIIQMQIKKRDELAEKLDAESLRVNGHLLQRRLALPGAQPALAAPPPVRPTLETSMRLMQLYLFFKSTYNPSEEEQKALDSLGIEDKKSELEKACMAAFNALNSEQKRMLMQQERESAQSGQEDAKENDGARLR